MYCYITVKKTNKLKQQTMVSVKSELFGPRCTTGQMGRDWQSLDRADDSSHGGIFVCTSNNTRMNTPVLAAVFVKHLKFNSLLIASSK